MAKKKPKNSESSPQAEANSGSISVGNLNFGGDVTNSIFIIGNENKVEQYLSAVEQNTEQHEPDYWALKHPYPMPKNFTGRIAERVLLTHWLKEDSENRLFILRALGGFGKSALSWQWLTHDVNPEDFPKVLWWSFYEGDASFEHFTEETLKYLKLEVPQGQRPQVDLLIKAMQGQKTLLIMDGFERALRAYSGMNAAYQGDEEKKEDNGRDCVNINAEIFLKNLCVLPNIKGKVLMTTRLTPRAVYVGASHDSPLKGFREFELTSMQPADAVEFFHKQGIKGTHAEIEAACVPYGYHPLSLRLLAGRILKDFVSPSDIVVAQKLKIDGDMIQQKHHVLEVSYTSLPQHEQKLLSTIACFRSPIELKTLEAIAENKNSLNDDLRDLIERGLLHFDEKNKKFDLHPIVRRYIYEEFPDKKKTHRQLIQYFQKNTEFKAHWVGGSQYNWHPRGVQDTNDLALFIELYHHTVQAGELDDAYRALQTSLDILVDRIGANQIVIEMLQVFFPEGEDKPPHLEMEDTRIQAQEYLANAYIQSGQPHRALLLLKQPRKWQNEDLPRVLISIGNLRVAQDHLQRRSKLPSSWYKEQNEVAVCELGNLYSIFGEWKAAEQEFSRILTTQGISQSDVVSFMWTMRAQHVLMMIRDPFGASANNCKLAIIYAQHALETAEKEEYFPIERNLIRGHWLLGEAHLINSDLQQAEYHLNEALTRDRTINMVDHESNILLDLARLRYNQKKYEEAKSLADEALLVTERCGYVLQGADVNLFLAQYALEQEKDKAKAKQFAEEAKKLATCDGPPYYYKVAYEEAERFLENLK